MRLLCEDKFDRILIQKVVGRIAERTKKYIWMVIKWKK